MRICLVYDCLYPYTVGGAERWYRNLAERLAAEGHDVTYLTRRQWTRGATPDIAGVRVVAVSPHQDLYAGDRRRVLPPLLFGVGVLRHLARHGGRYDVVHTASFPYFSLLAASLTRRRGYRLIVDWHELWSRAYWRDYLGAVGGWVGWRVQRACVRIPQRAFCFSKLHERRLHEEKVRGEVTRLEGQYAGPSPPAEPRPDERVVIFAGRLIPEKRAPALVPAIAKAQREIPDVRGEIYGDGPERDVVLRAITEHGLEGIVSARGFVDQDVLEEAMSRALCLTLPSSREGYGLVVIEAASRGVPTVLVAGPDNAATELVDEEVNGIIADSADPEDLAGAIVRVERGGGALRWSTLEWFRNNAERLSLERSLQVVLREYSSARS